jgi:hypothetical protein
MNDSKGKDLKGKDSRKDFEKDFEDNSIRAAIGAFATLNAAAFIMGILLIVKYNEKKNDTKIDKKTNDTALGVGIASVVSPIIVCICVLIGYRSKALGKILGVPIPILSIINGCLFIYNLLWVYLQY